MSSAFARRWERNWRPRVATGVAAVVGVAAGAGFIAATSKTSGAANDPAPTTNAGTNDGTSVQQQPSSTDDQNSRLGWGGDDHTNSFNGGFQPAPSGSDFGSGSSNFSGSPQSATHAS
jgi:hypothetical protein